MPTRFRSDIRRDDRTRARLIAGIRRHWLVSTCAALVLVGVVVAVVTLVVPDGGTNNTATPAVSRNPVVSTYQQQLPALALAVSKHPNDASALHNYGVALYATGNVSGARTQYEAALRIDQTDPVLLNNLGNVYRDLGSYDKALQSYQASIAHDPKAASAYVNLANLFNYTLNQRTLGLKTVQTGLRNLPDNPDLGVLLGITYEQLHDRTHALAAFKAVLAKNPGNPAAAAGAKRVEGLGPSARP